jgi:hypothetical protein
MPKTIKAWDKEKVFMIFGLVKFGGVKNKRIYLYPNEKNVTGSDLNKAWNDHFNCTNLIMMMVL